MKLVEFLRIIILFNGWVVIYVYFDRKIFYYRVLVMLYLIYKFCILIDLDIILILYYYDFEEFSIILIEVSNVIM